MEVVNIMLELPVEDGHLRAATVKAIAEHQKKHNVLCCAKTIYRMLKRHANGNAISGQFTGKGRPPTIIDAEVKRIAQLSNNTSLSPGEEMIVQHVKAIKHNNKMVDVTPATK
jgi:hypothetical protein